MREKGRIFLIPKKACMSPQGIQTLIRDELRVWEVRLFQCFSYAAKTREEVKIHNAV